MKDTKDTEILNFIKKLGLKDKGLHVKNIIDNERLGEFYVRTDHLSYDYSKQRITKETLERLLEIPDKINLKKSIAGISSGEFLNYTEERTASHMLYRNLNNPIETIDLNEIAIQRIKVKVRVEAIKELLDNRIDTIISISIGGSRLGSELLSEVCANPESKIKVHYCSSYDFQELKNVMSSSDARRTLVIISSKSFTTKEVMANAVIAKEWLEDSVGKNFLDQILGISSNSEGMKEFGIKGANQFKILDSLGGRYSIWSAMSLPAMLDMGWQNFEGFLQGAYAADKHFKESAWNKNIPVLMALLNAWNLNGLGINNLGIFSYDYKIRSLTKYLAQMGMESNGKTYNLEGEKIPFQTSPLIWGGYGPDAQHSVFQWLLQGTDTSSCDFIGIHKKDSPLSSSYRMLLAQIVALSIGEDNVDYKFKSVAGNNPVSLLTIQELNPANLGFLLATYEHKIFVESQIYNINPFDQWGVQLGKKLTTRSLKEEGFIKQYFNNEIIS